MTPSKYPTASTTSRPRRRSTTRPKPCCASSSLKRRVPRMSFRLFDSILICGPGLWHDLKDDEALAKIKQGRVTFEVPVLGEDGKPIRTEKLEGKLFQSRDEILLFWKA